MKKYLLVNDKYGNFNHLIEKYNLMKRQKLIDIDYMYKNLIVGEHFLSADQMVWFGKSLLDEDKFDFLESKSLFLVLDHSGADLYYANAKKNQFLHLRDCELFIYRGQFTSNLCFLKSLLEINKYSEELSVRIKGNLNMTTHVKHSTKMNLFNYIPKSYRSLTSGGILPIKPNQLRSDDMLYLLEKMNNPAFVLKVPGTCLGEGIHFFKNGVQTDHDGKRFVELVNELNKKNKMFILSYYKESDYEFRLYFINENNEKVKEVFSIVKKKQKGMQTHHSAGTINYKVVDLRKEIGDDSYNLLMDFLLKQKITSGALDVLQGEDGTLAIMENNSYSDILASDRVDLVKKWLDQRFEHFDFGEE